jgi:acyl-CoA thioester hydrolase
MKTFIFHHPLRWGDMDAMGHLNNTLYFRLLEEARIQWFASLNLPTHGANFGPILANISCDFVKPMLYPNTAVITQTVAKVGNSSLHHSCTIETLAEPGVIYARSTSVVVWMDYAAGKSAPWPQTISAQLNAQQVSSEQRTDR